MSRPITVCLYFCRILPVVIVYCEILELYQNSLCIFLVWVVSWLCIWNIATSIFWQDYVNLFCFPESSLHDELQFRVGSFSLEIQEGTNNSLIKNGFQIHENFTCLNVSNLASCDTSYSKKNMNRAVEDELCFGFVSVWLFLRVLWFRLSESFFILKTHSYSAFLL